MEWEFTAEDVVKGRCEYTLADFRHDLAQEVCNNLGGEDEAALRRSFNLLYDLCHALATGQDVPAYIRAFAYDPPTMEFLRELQPLMADNATMLGAILQRAIMDQVEQGAPLDQALEAVANWHSQVVANTPLLG